MGSALTALDKTVYSFETANSHGINWSEKKVYLITTKESAQEAEEFCKKYDTLYIDCKGHNFGTVNAAIGVIQIAVSEDICFLFDVIQCSDGFRVIKKLVESKEIRKVFHDSSEAVAALEVVRFAEVNGIHVRNLYDTQTGQSIIHNYRKENVNKKYSLRQLYENVVDKVFPTAEANSFGNCKWLEERPMSEDMIKYAAVDAVVLPEIYKSQRDQMAAKLIEDVDKVHSVQELFVQDTATSVLRDCHNHKSGVRSPSAPVSDQEQIYYPN